MTQVVMLMPISPHAGLTTVSLGMAMALQQQGKSVVFFKPVADDMPTEDRSTTLARNCDLPTIPPLSRRQVEDWIADDNYDDMLEEIVSRMGRHRGDAGVAIVEGLTVRRDLPYVNRLNLDIAASFGATIVLVGAPGEGGVPELVELADVGAHYFGQSRSTEVAGCIINRLGSPSPLNRRPQLAPKPAVVDRDVAEAEAREQFAASEVPLLGVVPWSQYLCSPRVVDLQRHLNATVESAGDIEGRRISRIEVWAGTISNSSFTAGQAIIVPGDRDDVLAGAALATMNGVELAAIVVSDGLRPNERISQLCSEAVNRGLPILSVDTDSWSTVLQLQDFNLKLPRDDLERMRASREHAARHIDLDWVKAFAERATGEARFSPPAFRFMLTERAQAQRKRIVLPEGDEPRTLRAALICEHRGIADCVLLGAPEQIHKVADQHGIVLNEDLEIINPATVRADYIDRLVELRSSKGVTALSAEEHLQDNVVLGTMMLEMGHVDGLVAGAVGTTANTIRPALQLIKTAPGASLVSSVFFMLLPDDVLVYGDCAINPDPDAEQLADIAIQSAESAAAFGISPRVALISYSTGSSGSGVDVEKVRQATDRVRELRPDLVVDGPLQYDAAVMESVARKKAPDSPVAGRANVLVFPDLNTGNTTYKAVQRSANLISIGPMLQGLRKPVNDLSRGALVDDIVYTIALTAIQAAQRSGR